MKYEKTNQRLKLKKVRKTVYLYENIVEQLKLMDLNISGICNHALINEYLNFTADKLTRTKTKRLITHFDQMNNDHKKELIKQLNEGQLPIYPLTWSERYRKANK